MTINGGRIVLLMMVLLSCGMLMPCLAKVYTVGDSAGWSLGVDYSTWPSGKTFKVGDTLSFNYGSSHSVDEVSSGDYGTCTAGNAIASYTSGPTTITLNTTGTHYFICAVAGHCSGGMKVSVSVTAGGGGGGGGGGAGASSAPSGTAKPTPTSPSGSSTQGSSAAFSPAVPLVYSLVILLIFKLVVS